MNLRKNQGFTLVELIVVIAILAILAGVAVPAYSGYIEKANKAGDLQLLAAVNTAFAAACLENGTDIQQVDAATLTYGGTEGAKTVAGIATVNGAANAGYDTAFQRYYAGNTGTFKVIKTLAFDATQHVFVDPSSVDSLSLSYGGGTITVSSALLNAWAASENLADIGVDGLLSQVADASKLAEWLMTENSNSTQYMNALTGDAYMNSLAASLGYESVAAFTNETGLSKEMLTTAVAMTYAAEQAGVKFTLSDMLNENFDKTEEYAAIMGAMNSSTTPQNILANNAILTAAASTTATTADELLNIVKDGVNVTELDNLKETGDAKTLADAAAVYVMYAAYCNKNGEEPNMNDLSTLLTGLANGGTGADVTEFQSYLNSSAAEADAQAYLEAINTINSSAKDPNVQQSILMNGFADDTLSTLLGSALGG